MNGSKTPARISVFPALTRSVVINSRRPWNVRHPIANRSSRHGDFYRLPARGLSLGLKKRPMTAVKLVAEKLR